MASLALNLLLASSTLAASIQRRVTDGDKPSGTVPSDTIKDCTYWVNTQSGDTCASIESAYAISESDFVQFNPSLGKPCKAKIGYSYCIEENYGAGLTKPTSTTSSPAQSPTSMSKPVSSSTSMTKPSSLSSPTSSTPTSTAAAKPSPTQDGLASNCNNYYKVKSGDQCSKIVDAYGTFTLNDFYTWNPAVGNDCSHLFVDYYVCVGVPGTPTSKPATSATPSPTNQPQQSGITKDCKNYYQVKSGDYCDKIVAMYGTFTSAQFYSWNPAVGSDCSQLYVGYYVCVGVSSTPTTKPTTSASPTGNSPSPTQSGIRSDCTKYYQAVSGDNCYAISNKFGTFSVQDFESWNPAVGSDCSQLYLGYYYCIAVPGTPTTPTSSTPTPTGQGPSPQQPGIVSNCRNYYKVSDGDYCDLIEQRNGISADQFFSWNTGLNRDCSNLFKGYYVCVGV